MRVEAYGEHVATAQAVVHSGAVAAPSAGELAWAGGGGVERSVGGGGGGGTVSLTPREVDVIRAMLAVGPSAADVAMGLSNTLHVCVLLPRRI